MKMIIISKGWITAHEPPRIVCLYRTEMSRQIRNQSSSRNSSSSFQSIESHPDRGRITISNEVTGSPWDDIEGSDTGRKQRRVRRCNPRILGLNHVNDTSSTRWASLEAVWHEPVACY